MAFNNERKKENMKILFLTLCLFIFVGCNANVHSYSQYLALKDLYPDCEYQADKTGFNLNTWFVKTKSGKVLIVYMRRRDNTLYLVKDMFQNEKGNK